MQEPVNWFSNLSLNFFCVLYLKLSLIADVLRNISTTDWHHTASVIAGFTQNNKAWHIPFPCYDQYLNVVSLENRSAGVQKAI